ncbi:MAG: TonB-dependent receptor [Candidatus Zhuqueibacterota bacterium]
MYKTIIITLALILSFIISIQAQTPGAIRGAVASSEGTPLEGVNIIIDGTTLGAATDAGGHFHIGAIPEGVYTITASRIGFAKSTMARVEVKSNQTLELRFIMQQAPIDLEKVTVTAMRLERNIADVPVATHVITSKKIQQIPAQNAGEALSSFSSITMKGNADLNSLQTISLRGSTDSQVLVLLDGQRLNNSQSASLDFSTLPVDFIEKIEIVKGGHSALYGTNAVGGVIHIISKSSPMDRNLSAGIKSGLGSWNSQFNTIHMAQQIGKFNYFIAYNNLRSDGDYSYKASDGTSKTRANNDLKKNEAFVKANYKVTDSSSLQLFASYGTWERGLPGSITFPSTTQRLQETRNMYNLAYENSASESWLFKTNAYVHRSDQNYTDSSPYAAEDTDHKNDAIGFDFQNRYSLSDWLQISSGYDFRQDKLNSTKYQKCSRDIHGFYLMGEVTTGSVRMPVFQKIILVPALRYDKFTDYEGELSPKFGVVFSHASQYALSLRGNVGSSFRAPTFNDLYWPADMWSAGNPDLKPERGLNYDLGLLAEFNPEAGKVNIEISYFVNDIENLNIWKEVSPWFWQPQNIDKSLTRGAEVQLSWSLFQNKMNVRAAHTYLDATYNSEDSPLFGNYLEYRPRHKVDAGIGLDLTFAGLNVIYRYLDKSYKNELNTQSISPSHQFDANIAVTRNVFGVAGQMRLDVFNLFDRQYVTFGDQPMPGRQVRLSFGVQY